jgi:hypothetical protein
MSFTRDYEGGADKEDLMDMLDQAKVPDNASVAKEGEYIEKRRFCYCMPLKVGIVVFGVVLILDLLIEALNFCIIITNGYFDKMFGLLYLTILLPLAFGAVAYIYYFSSRNRKGPRSWLPCANLLAFISSLLLIFWIIIYICVFYQRDEVFISKWDSNLNPNLETLEDQKGKWQKQSKAAYVIWHIIPPVTFGLAFLLFYFTTADWVKRHENQEKAYG